MQERKEEKKEKRKSGRAEGMNLFALLVSRLFELGRSEDIRKAAADAAYRNQLPAEFSLQ